MRLHNRQSKTYGRRWIALLLICGLLLPCAPARTQAAIITYRYDWITDVSGLPTDGNWHDYFIAWEDNGDYWFTDYNYYTLDGDSNVDVGGLAWMEYKSNSKLQNTTDRSFTSGQCMGHMQIKFVGYDSDNGNSPMYHIRFRENNGNYKYVDRWNPDPEPDSADNFTFQDKGDVFYIFVNIKDQADSYLTRDGDQLETSLSSSSSEDEYPLRVYKRSIDSITEEPNADFADRTQFEGKITMYQYEWVNSLERLNKLCAQAEKKWVDVMLAWEDCDEENDISNNSSKIWYTKEVWYSDDGVNYKNDDYIMNSRDNHFYWSNSTLGSDRYTANDTDSFTTLAPVSHFQVWHGGKSAMDSDNHHDGYRDANGKKVKCPTLNFRFMGENNTLFYVGDALFYDQDHLWSGFWGSPFTVQLQLDEDKKGESGYYYGSAEIFTNRSNGDDVYMTRKGNRMDVSFHNFSDPWEYPFRIYSCQPVEYDAIIKSFVIGEGSTYSIEGKVVLKEGVTITVENGGVLMIDERLYNNGHIQVNAGGTVILNEGSHMMPFGTKKGGTITVDGGNLLVLEEAKLLCDEGTAALRLNNGATVINRGLIDVGFNIDLENKSVLRNEKNAVFAVGKCLSRGRGGVGGLSVAELRDKLSLYAMFQGCVYQDSKLLYYNSISSSPSHCKWYYSSGGESKRLQ